MRIPRQPVHDRHAVMSRRMAWLLAFLGFTAFGLLNFQYRYLDDLARQHQHTFAMRMFEEMTGVYVGLAIFPFTLWAVRRARIRRANWWFMAPLNLFIMIAFSVCNTAVMAVTRSLLAPVFGLGEYDYGIMRYRFPMELGKHVPIFCIFVAAIYVVDSYREARNRQLDTVDLEARLAEAQLQNLRLQLHPHFLFNALNTISSVMHEDVDRADTMLAQLSDLLRRTLDDAGSLEVRLDEELDLLRSYLAIMKERFGEGLNVDFVIDPTLSKALVPQFILQPLVENSIRYARDPKTSKLEIRIDARRDNHDLMLRVRDNGPGIPDLESGDWSRGIGLSNTEQRLDGLYGANHRMVLENEDGLSVTLRFPLRSEAVAL